MDEDTARCLGLRKVVNQHEENLTDNVDFIARVNSFHDIDTGKLETVYLKLQLSGRLGHFISNILLANISPNMLKSIGMFLVNIGEELEAGEKMYHGKEKIEEE